MRCNWHRRHGESTNLSKARGNLSLQGGTRVRTASSKGIHLGPSEKEGGGTELGSDRPTNWSSEKLSS